MKLIHFCCFAVCGNIDVRNFVDSFIQLNDCQVVEGNLQIGLMTNTTTSSAINNLTFPMLREVTGFVLLYRVNGLRSLGTLFPNLAVIRGRTLFVNYALVVYELQDLTVCFYSPAFIDFIRLLQEIGMYSLTNVLRGSVRLEKNPRLCYVDTIDWNLIAPNGANAHFIKVLTLNTPYLAFNLQLGFRKIDPRGNARNARAIPS